MTVHRRQTDMHVVKTNTKTGCDIKTMIKQVGQPSHNCNTTSSSLLTSAHTNQRLGRHCGAVQITLLLFLTEL